MRPADLVALLTLPPDLTAIDAVPPAVVAALMAAGWWLRWRKQTASERDQADTSTWRRMQEANEVIVRQRDDALEQVERRDERIRQLAEHITELEDRNRQLRGDLRAALKSIDHKERPDVGTSEE